MLGALDLVKGFDFEEAALSFAAAALLWLGRGAFYVRHDRPVPRALLRALAAAAASVAVVGGFVVAIAHVYSPRLVAHETADLLLWRQGPVAFGDDAAWLPFAAGAIALGGLLALAYLAFRPLAPPVEHAIGASPTSSSAHTAATRSPSSSSAGTRSTSSAPTGARSSGTGSRGT